jgi:transcriptional regulator with XRE-family HTH domain
MTTQTTASAWGDFPEFGPGDRIRLLRRKVLNIQQTRLADALGVSKETLSAWESGRNEGGISVAVALRLEMLTGRPGTAAFVLGVLPTSPSGGPMLPRLDSNQKPPGLRYRALAAVAA